MSLISQSVDHTSHDAYFKKASLNLMSHTAVTTPGTLRLLLARTTPGPQRSRAESRRLLLARDTGTGTSIAVTRWRQKHVVRRRSKVPGVRAVDNALRHSECGQ